MEGKSIDVKRGRKRMEIEIDIREKKAKKSGNSGISVTGMRRYIIAYDIKKKWERNEILCCDSLK